MYLFENNSVSGWKNQCFTPIMWLLLMLSKTPRGNLCVKEQQPVLFCLKSEMCISAPRTARVFQACVDTQMAARGISCSPKSAVTGHDFSPRCCSKYLWVCVSTLLFHSLPQSRRVSWRGRWRLSCGPHNPALLSAAQCGLRCHPQSWVQPCRWVLWQCWWVTPVGTMLSGW